MRRSIDYWLGVRLGVLTVVAFGGSLIYGASASAAFPVEIASRSALLLTLSTGCAWVVFGLLLWGMIRKPALMLAEACLVAMAYGEAILVSGAIINRVILLIDPATHAVLLFNIGIVAWADSIMAVSLAKALLKTGIQMRVTFSLWVFALNGSWFFFLWLFSRILSDGPR